MTDIDATTYDVLVVGGGISGGMSAAAYLQKAGCRVAVIERDAAGAPFSSFYEPAPGVRFDVTPVNFSIVSPAIADLELGRFGYRVRPPEVLFSTLDGAGRHMTLYADATRTRRELARHSARDAERFQTLLHGLRGAARDILATAFFSPSPDLASATRLTATAAGLEPARLTHMSAIDLVAELFESDAARIALTALPAINLFGDLAAPGQGALAWLWTFLMRTCSVSPDGVTLAHAVERAFLHHGGTVLKSMTVRRFLRGRDGRCRGVEADAPSGRITLHARRAVVSDLGAELTGELLGEPLRPGWRSAGRTVFTADAVLDRPLRWTHEGFDRAPRVYLLWDSWGACTNWLRAARREEEAVFLGHIELTQFWLLYGRGADGSAGLRIRFGTGPFGSDPWPTRRGFYEGWIRDRIRRLDADVVIRSLQLRTPQDYWDWNPAARHGNPVGGDFIAGQWMNERMPYRSAIPGLYMSNSVWPTSLSWMAPGYNVASVVAEDLGIPRPTWWSHPPLPDFAT